MLITSSSDHLRNFIQILGEKFSKGKFATVIVVCNNRQVPIVIYGVQIHFDEEYGKLSKRLEVLEVK